ncbi:MAG: hypothetical protein V2A79_13835 [Planctomycetota bacterium]
MQSVLLVMMCVGSVPTLLWAQTGTDVIPAGIDAFQTMGYVDGQSYSYYDFS